MSIKPFLLFPAFRHGKDTPWGGDELHRLYGKKTDDPRTGESLEMSVIPGLNSLDAQGTPLSELIAQYGEKLVGAAVRGDFPLLLKLIDAREQLSVQVHPDDSYAREHENKLGKTEAWVILHAQPGAKLVYGMREGVTKEQLKEACADGKKIEKLLRFVPVHPGDVYYIPSGTVHAIGAGIVLYEIQQSSDVTYRFYDWDRTDAQGNRRTLHIQQGLDVTRLDLQPDAAVPTALPDDHCRRELLLDTDYFRLERLRDCQAVPFVAAKTQFSVLTSLSDGVLRLADEEISLTPGQTVFIPADCAAFDLTCQECLIASPAYKKG